MGGERIAAIRFAQIECAGIQFGIAERRVQDVGQHRLTRHVSRQRAGQVVLDTQLQFAQLAFRNVENGGNDGAPTEVLGGMEANFNRENPALRTECPVLEELRVAGERGADVGIDVRMVIQP